VPTITQRFDRAAGCYDQAASVQVQVAEHLVATAAQAIKNPQNILDFGCGTGFALQAARRRWPQSSLTACDASSAMLREARRKIPDLRLVQGDAVQAQFDQKFDLILSSMMLHWMPQPREALMHWRTWLKPQGLMYVALPVEGSFYEWRDLCGDQGSADGLWPLPPNDFAHDLATQSETTETIISYPSAQDFISRLKESGAATPRFGHKLMGYRVMRHVLAAAPKPFLVTYRLCYLQVIA
jgi:malonyl-ACP O-methyltransferase BioC